MAPRGFGELNRGVRAMERAEDLAALGVQAGEECGPAVAGVAVGSVLHSPGPHGQERLGDPVAEFAPSRRHTPPEPCAGLRYRATMSHTFSEQRILGELEGLDALQLQGERPPDARDGVLA